MIALKSANLAIRFLLELAVLAAVGYWGYKTGKGVVVRTALAIGTPLLVAVVWGMFGAPGSSIRWTGPLHLALEVIIFGSGPAALYAVGRPSLASGFAVAVVINRILMFVWQQ